MLEIYNENVQDLLVHPRDRPKKGLLIRESKQAGGSAAGWHRCSEGLGVFVEGVSSRPVESFSDIVEVVEEGTSNRSIGATLMNATSSRAHTVIAIEFRLGRMVVVVVGDCRC